MSLKLQWHIRQLVSGIIMLPASATMILVALCAIRAYKFYNYGIALYPDIAWPKTIHIQDILRVYWTRDLFPFLPWFIVTLPVDLFLRRHVYRLME